MAKTKKNEPIWVNSDEIICEPEIWAKCPVFEIREIHYHQLLKGKVNTACYVIATISSTLGLEKLITCLVELWKDNKLTESNTIQSDVCIYFVIALIFWVLGLLIPNANKKLMKQIRKTLDKQSTTFANKK